MEKQLSKAAFPIWLLGRVRRFAIASTSLLRPSLWPMLFLLNWAPTVQAATPVSERAIPTNLEASPNGGDYTNKNNWNGAARAECTR